MEYIALYTTLQPMTAAHFMIRLMKAAHIIIFHNTPLKPIKAAHITIFDNITLYTPLKPMKAAHIKYLNI